MLVVGEYSEKVEKVWWTTDVEIFGVERHANTIKITRSLINAHSDGRRFVIASYVRVVHEGESPLFDALIRSSVQLCDSAHNYLISGDIRELPGYVNPDMLAAENPQDLGSAETTTIPLEEEP